ncbi:MAG: TatD family hydrolase [Lachnospiraceae bacterium]|nr:TatD family hydrolase [Lachnospiraceae bacterium]
MIFETHAHYDNGAFDEDREEVLAALKEAGVGVVVNAGASLKTVKGGMALAEAREDFYFTVGVHPSDTAELNEENFAWLKEALKHPKAVAVGEIGLDYYWPEPEHEWQKEWFVRQLALAKEAGKPVVIHSRDAAQDTLDIMKAEAKDLGGIIHCFSYGTEMAREYLNMGYYLGIGGVLTFKNGRKLKEVAAYAPLDRIVLETDCPYLSPVPYRGKRNSSLYLPYVIEELAAIKGITTEEVERITFENAVKVYRLGGIYG